MAMKKTKNNTNGKGDKNRVTDKKRFDSNWDKIFNNKVDKEIHQNPLGVGFAHKDIKRESNE